MVDNERLGKGILCKTVIKRAGVALLISNKIDFISKTVTRDKERHDKIYIMIKGSIHQKDITIINTDVPNTGIPKYMNQTLAKFN